jgi:hypothetical protein
MARFAIAVLWKSPSQTRWHLPWFIFILTSRDQCWDAFSTYTHSGWSQPSLWLSSQHVLATPKCLTLVLWSTLTCLTASQAYFDKSTGQPALPSLLHCSWSDFIFLVVTAKNFVIITDAFLSLTSQNFLLNKSCQQDFSVCPESCHFL